MCKFLLLLLFIPAIINCQSIIWESSQKIGTDPSASTFSKIIDSDGNIILLIDGINSFMAANLLKFDTSGNNLAYNFLRFDQKSFPVSFYETEHGYKMLGFADSTKLLMSLNNLLPMIINLNKNCDTINTEFPYNIYEPDNYKKYSTDLSMFGSRAVFTDSKFYNSYINSKVMIDSNLAMQKDHLIITCYNKDGNFLWQKGYDTVKGSFDSYQTIKFKKTLDNTLLAVIKLTSYKSSDYNYSAKIIEIDADGNNLNKIDFKIDDKSIVPEDAVKLSDGSILILCQYIDKNNKNHFIAKFSKTNQLEKITEIPQKSLFNYLSGMSVSQSGNIVIFGHSVTEYNEPENSYDDSQKLYLAKLNSNLDFEWEYQWYEHIYFEKSSNINDAFFLDENNIIAIGFKDYFNAFTAKISLIPTDIIEESTDNSSLLLAPNPTSDFIEINFKNEAGIIASNTVQIFNIFGLEVYTTQTGRSELLKIDVSHLPSGVYFVKIGDKFEKFVKK